MKAATLFSGIGAPEQAMPSWDWLWHAEIEPFPSAVMGVRHPLSVNLGDVSAEDFCHRAAALGRPDVLVFGSPCQSFSVAGKRLGLDDPRGNLALVALGIIARLRPTWFVFENVPGLLSSADGRDFGLFLRAVDDIGYHVAWRVLDAQYAGVAQRRRRVFAVGHTRDWRRAAAVLLEPDRLCGHPPTRSEAWERIAPTLEGRAGRSGANNFATSGGLINVAPTLGAGPTSGGRTYGTCPDTCLSLVPERARALTTSSQRLDGESETFVPIAFRVNDHGADTGTPDQAPTLRRQGVQGVRRLTPRECERLQGMADDYTLITYRGKPAADGPRYKAIGNSMAVPVIRWILSRIEQLEQLVPERAA